MSAKNDDLLREYPADLIESGERGKYAKRYYEDKNLVRIDPDLRKLFPDAESVNNALRAYARKLEK
ncbi:MAG TPA: hypothetical protein VIV14_07750 [Gammaproteobacteria bacterium]